MVSNHTIYTYFKLQSIHFEKDTKLNKQKKKPNTKSIWHTPHTQKKIVKSIKLKQIATLNIFIFWKKMWSRRRTKMLILYTYRKIKAASFYFLFSFFSQLEEVLYVVYICWRWPYTKSFPFFSASLSINALYIYTYTSFYVIFFRFRKKFCCYERFS